MADITKCKGTGCRVREDCYRYTAPASEWQSWFAVAPVSDDENGCDMMIDTERKRNERNKLD
jgi:hypothetical protein